MASCDKGLRVLSPSLTRYAEARKRAVAVWLAPPAVQTRLADAGGPDHLTHDPRKPGWAVAGEGRTGGAASRTVLTGSGIARVSNLTPVPSETWRASEIKFSIFIRIY